MLRNRYTQTQYSLNQQLAQCTPLRRNTHVFGMVWYVCMVEMIVGVCATTRGNWLCVYKEREKYRMAVTMPGVDFVVVAVVVVVIIVVVAITVRHQIINFSCHLPTKCFIAFPIFRHTQYRYTQYERIRIRTRTTTHPHRATKTSSAAHNTVCSLSLSFYH